VEVFTQYHPHIGIPAYGPHTVLASLHKLSDGHFFGIAAEPEETQAGLGGGHARSDSYLPAGPPGTESSIDAFNELAGLFYTIVNNGKPVQGIHKDMS
jgi:hypothetical protein